MALYFPSFYILLPKYIVYLDISYYNAHLTLTFQNTIKAFTPTNSAYL